MNAVKYAEYADDNNNITLYAKWEKISTTPTTPTDTTKSESPATGDDSGIGAFTVMMIAALGAAAAIGSRRRANNR
ncbi:MAG: LPXTG cell wall anchor domain-containing protein [Eubacterium sp.]